MNPTSAVLAAPGDHPTYGLSFLLPLNVFSTYYFQAIMKPAISFEVSVGRGALIQRTAYPAAACSCRTRCPLAGHAADRTYYGCVCDLLNDPLHQTASGSESRSLKTGVISP